MLNDSFKCNDTARLSSHEGNAYDYNLTRHGAAEGCYSRRVETCRLSAPFCPPKGELMLSAAPTHPKASFFCCYSGLPYRLRLPFPCAAGANTDAEGGGGARHRHSFPPVWWRRSPPGSEAAPFCPAPAAGEDSMAQHPKHLPKSQPGASQPGTPAHHCEALGINTFDLLNRSHHRRRLRIV